MFIPGVSSCQLCVALRRLAQHKSSDNISYFKPYMSHELSKDLDLQAKVLVEFNFASRRSDLSSAGSFFFLRGKLSSKLRQCQKEKSNIKCNILVVFGEQKNDSGERPKTF